MPGVNEKQREPLLALESIFGLRCISAFLPRLSPSTSQRDGREKVLPPQPPQGDAEHAARSHRSPRTPEGTQAPGLPHAHSLLFTDQGPPQHTPALPPSTGHVDRGSLARMGHVVAPRPSACQGLPPRGTAPATETSTWRMAHRGNKGRAARNKEKERGREATTRSTRKSQACQQSQSGEKKR